MKRGVRKALEIGGGTGLHSIILAKAGIEAYLCDISPNMLDEARKNISAEGLDVDVRMADWLQLEQAYQRGEFDGVIFAFNSVSLNLTMEGLIRNFESVYAVLAPEGSFCLDLRNYEAYNLHTPDDKYIALSNDALEVEVSLALPLEAGLVNLVTTHKGSETKIQQFIRTWKPEDVRRALVQTGFRDIQMHHDFRIEQVDINQPIDSSIKYIQIAATKPAYQQSEAR